MGRDRQGAAEAAGNEITAQPASLKRRLSARSVSGKFPRRADPRNSSGQRLHNRLRHTCRTCRRSGEEIQNLAVIGELTARQHDLVRAFFVELAQPDAFVLSASIDFIPCSNRPMFPICSTSQAILSQQMRIVKISEREHLPDIYSTSSGSVPVGLPVASSVIFSTRASACRSKSSQRRLSASPRS